MELSDLHYILDVEKTDEGNKFLLKGEISKELISYIDDMKFFTINKTHKDQHSSRIIYKTKKQVIESGNFKDDPNSVSVFMCKE